MPRKPKFPTDMSALFKTTSGTLAQIAEKTNSLSKLADIVRQTCPDLPEDVWKIANFRENILVIEVNSPVWSQRLQFERMNICRELAQVTDNQFNQITIKVVPIGKFKQVTAKEAPPVQASFSAENAKQMREVASKAPESLRKKIEQLARHGERNSE